MTDNAEAVLSANTTILSATSYTIGLVFGPASAHANGGVVKLANSYDGTHGNGLHNQRIGDTGVASAKIAGLIP